jgi:hypothetical protein
VTVTIIALLPIVFAIIYKQYPFPLPGILVDEHIDTTIPPLFAIADIHGDYPRALAALIHAGVVDEQGDWKAGNATFVRSRV